MQPALASLRVSLPWWRGGRAVPAALLLSGPQRSALESSANAGSASLCSPSTQRVALAAAASSPRKSNECSRHWRRRPERRPRGRIPSGGYSPRAGAGAFTRRAPPHRCGRRSCAPSSRALLARASGATCAARVRLGATRCTSTLRRIRPKAAPWLKPSCARHPTEVVGTRRSRHVVIAGPAVLTDFLRPLAGQSVVLHVSRESDEEEPMNRPEITPASRESTNEKSEPGGCCTTSELATCCEASAKDGCCGPQADNAEKAPVSCGCR